MKMWVMKKLLIGSIVILYTQCAIAQTWGEWFQQKKTQKQYLLQQIAALKVYTNYLSEGYSIAQNGLVVIQDIKKGDFNLHSNYFNSLITVNPKIKRYANVSAIIAMQVSIAKQTSKAIRSFISSQEFTAKEIAYIKNVFENLLSDCSENLDELIELITNGNLQLKDDERIGGIDKLYDGMQEKQRFTHSFCTSTARLLIQRSHTADEIIISQKLNGLK
jgi:hypothetical protein